MLTTSTLNQNYFELLGLPEQFVVDQSLLKKNLQAIQKQVHPDKFSSASRQEQMLAMQISTLVNTAYQTLSNDLYRAVYLLKINNLDIGAETDTQMPADFLMKQIEVHEVLAEIEDNEQSLSELDVLRIELQKERNDLLEKLTDEFAQKNYSVARDGVRKLQFIDKLQLEVKRKIISIEDALLS